MAKFNMSQSAVGMAAEYEGQIGFNCLWPCTSVATAAVNMLGGGIAMQASRTVDNPHPPPSSTPCARVPIRRARRDVDVVLRVAIAITVEFIPV